MSHRDGRVVLSAWVEPAVRADARKSARMAGLPFSRWVERAVRQTMAREAADYGARIGASDPRKDDQGPRGDEMSYPTSPSGTWSRYRDSRYYGPTWVFCIGPKKHWNEPSAHAFVTTVARGYRLTVHVCEDALGRRDVCDLIFTTRDEAMTVGMNTCAAEMRSLEVTK